MHDNFRGQVFIDGVPRPVRLDTDVETPVVERILHFTARPTGGVHVIQHAPTDSWGRDFYQEFRDHLPGMATCVAYTTFDTDRIPQTWVQALNRMDEVWVPSHFNWETFRSAGVDESKLQVIPIGLDPELYQPAETMPMTFGEEKGFTFLTVSQWTFRKGLDVLIRAFVEEFEQDEDVRLVIRADLGHMPEDAGLPPFQENITDYLLHLEIDPEQAPSIQILHERIPAVEMPSFYRMADAYVAPVRGEGWGTPMAEAMLMELPVIATRWGGHLEFMNDRTAYLIGLDSILPVDEDTEKDNPLYAGGHHWAEPSVHSTRALMRRVFTNRAEAREKARAAREHVAKNFTIRKSSAKIAARLLALEKSKGRPESGESASSASAQPIHKRIKVLFQARPEIYTIPGEDTEILSGMRAALQDAGIRVDFSCNPQEPLDDYDLVHLFSLEPALALNAAMQQTPFVMTRFYEEADRHHLPSNELAGLFRETMASGYYEELEQGLLNLAMDENCPIPADVRFVVCHADALLVSGSYEEERLKERVPDEICMERVAMGMNRPESEYEISPDLFADQFGVRDFALCVGPLKARWNQLMLLYALKDEEMPVVFVNTPTDQPEYEELCKTFRRKGQTLFTGSLSRKMLISAFRAARIHMLACWYELPRMASLTAVQFGCKVVVPENVTTREYLGDRAYYCEPKSPPSIRDAVMGAWNDETEAVWPGDLPVTTWAQTAEQVAAIYEKILLRGWTEEGQQEIKARATRVREELSYRHLRDEIHQRAEGSHQETLEMSACLHAVRPDDPIVLFIQGMAYFGLSQMEDAEERLRRTLELAPYFDAKAYLYLGLIYLKQGKYRKAMNVLDRACRAHPFMPDDTAVLISNYLLLARQGAGELNLTPGGNGWSGTGPART